jgi:hypothetical protein
VDENGDFRDDLLKAKQRDLSPLFEESFETLELDSDQERQMEIFLDEAWFGGTYTGHAQLVGWAQMKGKEVPPPDMKLLEANFKQLMHASADALNLTLPLTIQAWGILGRAWVAGARSCKAELMGLIMESQTDVAAEALKWLEEGGSE